jgi:hypothetical protein
MYFVHVAYYTLFLEFFFFSTLIFFFAMAAPPSSVSFSIHEDLLRMVGCIEGTK